MMKLFSEERTGLKIELSLKFFFLFIFFFQNIFSQIPIKGFCKYNYFNTETDFNNLIAMNFNGDLYMDMVLFNSEHKQVVSYAGNQRGEYDKRNTSSIPYEINNIRLLDYAEFPYIFAFTSRTNMRTGIYEFRSNGVPILRSSLRFDSYPENISIADVNDNGKNEMLISGGAFNGLSVVSQQGSRLQEKRIVEGTAFSQAVFIDLSNDGYPDIAAYDIVSGAFSFFYNNSIGEFRKVRSVPVSDVSMRAQPEAGRVSYLRTMDFNNDSYHDIVFSAGNYINIWYGDFRSAYEDKKRISTQFKPDKFILGDFNRDGFTDIAYLNYSNSVISIIYSKNENEFYPEIIYLQKEDLKDIVFFSSRFNNVIAVLSSQGKIHTITNLSSIPDIVDLSIGGKPSAISFFDYEKNGINDICFIDNYDSRIKFLIRNAGGIPDIFYSYQLFENHSNIIVKSLKPEEINFICYSPYQKLIEIIIANFKTSKIERRVLYSPGLIQDLKIKGNSKNSYDILITYAQNGELRLGIFSGQESNFIFSERVIRQGDFTVSSIGILEGISVYYWQVKNNAISLFHSDNDKTDETPKTLFTHPVSGNVSITSFTGEFYNLGKDASINFISDTKNSFAVIIADNIPVRTINSVTLNNETREMLRITSGNQLFFGETRFKGLKRLCIYLPDRNSVSRLDLTDRGKNMVQVHLSDKVNLDNYFIKNMTSRNYHIVYTDSDKNSITIKRLRG